MACHFTVNFSLQLLTQIRSFIIHKIGNASLQTNNKLNHILNGFLEKNFIIQNLSFKLNFFSHFQSLCVELSILQELILDRATNCLVAANKSYQLAVEIVIKDKTLSLLD